MIVKNEEELLEDCLSSVQGIVEEIVIADTGSDDKTAAVAQRYGAKIFPYSWDNSFSNARNFAMEKAGYEWLLLLDADERLFYEDRQKLLDFIAAAEYDGAHFKVYNYVGGNNCGQYTLHNALRLIRNKDIYRFKGDIHEQIRRTDGASIKNCFAVTDIRLHHLGYLDAVAARKDKRNRNIPMLLRELEKEPENAFTLFNLGNEYMALKDYEKALSLYEQARAHYSKTEAYALHLLFRRAMCFYSLEQYGKSAEALEEGLSVFPGCTDMAFLKGIVYMDWRRDVLAVEWLQKAMEMGEPPPALRFSDGCATVRLLLSLALIYERQGDYAKAAACYAKAVNSDGKLYSALYSAAGCFKKMQMKPDQIAQKLSMFFSDPDYTPNRLMLLDILLSHWLYEPVEAHLAFLESMDEYAAEKAALSGKYHFCRRHYEKARACFEEALENREQLKVFRDVPKDSALHLFATLLLLDCSDGDTMRKTADTVESCFGRPAALVCKQLMAMREGKTENLLKGEAPEALLHFFSRLLQIILNNCEFELFEQLLYLYNDIDSPRVLLELARVYLEDGFPELAASAVLRSVKELDTIDAAGARLLADALFETGLSGNQSAVSI